MEGKKLQTVNLPCASTADAASKLGRLGRGLKAPVERVRLSFVEAIF